MKGLNKTLEYFCLKPRTYKHPRLVEYEKALFYLKKKYKNKKIHNYLNLHTELYENLNIRFSIDELTALCMNHEGSYFNMKALI